MKTRRQLIIFWLIGCGLVALISAELLVRFGIGLGDPPLWQLDPKIEYFAEPGEYQRFGNRVDYNAFSMRSDDFSETKTDPEEVRVMVIGDSVVNGGSALDQSELATEVARTILEDKLGQPVVIGNISAGSWGPANQLEYLRRFGTFDADLVILVSHTGEVDDAPKYDVQLGVTQAMTDSKPLLAIQELVGRYAMPYLVEKIKSMSPGSGKIGPSQTEEFEFTTRPEMEAIDELIAASGADFKIFLHPRGSELSAESNPRAQAIEALARERSIPLYRLAPRYQHERDKGDQIYFGDIHLNQRGQELLAEEIVDAVQAWSLESNGGDEAASTTSPTVP